MRYRVTRLPAGFEVQFGDDRAEILPDHTIISYRSSGLAGMLSDLAGQQTSYLTISENTTKEQLLNALLAEIVIKYRR
jgi:hypothetical protein